ncbi:MAG: YcxB family protein [Lachnospiraceae bacterium]|nr:YcxB family protein [Lachnospiraceae bacterium]
MEKEIKATVKLKASDLFCFFVYYSYVSIAGICELLFSIGGIVLLIIMWGSLSPAYILVLGMCGALFTVVNPWMLFKKAKKQVSTSPAFKEPVSYVFSEEGIHLEMGNEKADLKWSEIFKVRKVAGRIFLYFNHIRANVVPVSAFESKEDAKKLMEIVKKSRKNVQYDKE